MKVFTGVALALLLLVTSANLAAAEESEWQKLNAQAEKSFFAGQYGESIEKTKQAFALAEKSYGLQSREAATSLSLMGHLLLTTGQTDKAEVAYQQSMDIRKKVLGTEHADYGESLGNLAGLYRTQGRYIESEPLTQKAIAIQEKTLGLTHDDYLANISNLGLTYAYLGQYAKAETYFKQAIATHEKKSGVKDVKLVMPLNNLADAYRKQGKYDQAEIYYTRAIAILESSFGPDHPNVAMFNNNLAQLHFDRGDYPQAKRLLQKSLEIFERTLDAKHPLVATTLVTLGNVHLKLGQYEQAEKMYLQAKSLREATYGLEHPEYATTLSNLGTLYHEQSRHAEAEAMHLKVLPILEKVYGKNHPDVATSLSNLALVYTYQGRFEDALPLMQRALAIREKVYGPEHQDVANSMNNLGDVYTRVGDDAKAEPLLRRAIAIYEKVLGPDFTEISAAAGNLAQVYSNGKRYRESEQLYLRAIAIIEKNQGKGHARLASILNSLATVYQLQEHYDKAESLYKQSLSIWQAALGEDHYQISTALDNLALLYQTQGRDTEALETSRRSVDILRKRFVNNDPVKGSGKLAEQKSNRHSFILHLLSLNKTQVSAKDKNSIASESFETAQLARASSVSQSLAQMAARFAQRGDALAELVRAQQDVRDAQLRANKSLLDAFSLPSEKRNAESELKLRDDIAALNKKLGMQNIEIANRFPKYLNLISQEPVAAAETQKLLNTDEAMLVYTTSIQGSFAWVVTRQNVSFHSLPVTLNEIEQQVQFLRSKLVPNAAGQLSKMTPATSRRLSQEIFAPLESSLVGIKHILLVPDGALQSLPFGVLSSSKEGDSEWLAKRYAFSVLPSVSALRALRLFSQNETGKLAFAGFGNPILSTDKGSTRSLGLGQVFKTRSLAAGNNSANDGLADVEALRSAPSLPETADELRAISAVLNGSSEALFLGPQATETKVKQSNLADYRFLAFATHGVMAGELSGVIEPGLVLTPPSVGTAQDDGYLSASEVAQLKLNADWVLLSACNTAAPDGTPGAEGLSGLAKAFFYAGTRSLLVSNWPVASDATKILITDTVSTYANAPKIGKAEAIKQAMGRMMEKPEYAHPFFWGAFMVVGE